MFYIFSLLTSLSEAIDVGVAGPIINGDGKPGNELPKINQVFLCFFYIILIAIIIAIFTVSIIKSYKKKDNLTKVKVEKKDEI